MVEVEREAQRLALPLTPRPTMEGRTFCGRSALPPVRCRAAGEDVLERCMGREAVPERSAKWA
jgi:hypothetical protein